MCYSNQLIKMTNYSEDFKRIKNDVKELIYVGGRHVLEAPWIMFISFLFGVLINVTVHSYFNGLTNTLMLMVDHPLAMGLAPCVYGRTPYWAFIFIMIAAGFCGYYGGRAYYEYRFRNLFNSPNWDE